MFCSPKKSRRLDKGYRQLVSLMLPAGVKQYFELINVVQDDEGVVKIYLEILKSS